MTASKRTTRRLPLALAILFTATPLAAQEPPATLTLQEAIDLARQNNPAFRATANDGAVSDWRVREAFGRFLPSLNVRGGMDYQASGTPRFGQYSGAELGLSRTPSYFFSDYFVSSNLQLSGATFFNAAQARSNAVATDTRIEAAAYTLATNVTRQYLTAMRARDNVALQQSVLAAADEAHKLATARFEAGDGTRLDVAQAEVTRGRGEIALIQAESSYDTERVRLLQQMGVEIDRDIELTSEFTVFEPTWDLPTLVDMALRGHPQLASARAAESAANAASRAAKMQYLPTLNLSAGLASGYARRANDTEYLLAEGRSDAEGAIENCQFWNQLASGLSSELPGYPRNCSALAFNDEDAQRILSANDRFPFDFDEGSPLSLSLSISLPIVNGFSRELNVQTARADAQDAQYQRRGEELARRVEVTESYNALMTAYRTVGLEARNAETAGEQLFLERERYRLGAGSILELTVAQEQKARADQSHLNALYSFHENLAALEAAVGRSLR